MATKKRARTRKSAGGTSGSEFIRSMPATMKASDVVKAGKKKGITFSANLVYAVRARSKAASVEPAREKTTSRKRRPTTRTGARRPAPTNVRREVRQRLDAFADELEELIHEAAIAAVHEALETGPLGDFGVGATRKRQSKPKAGKSAAAPRRSRKTGVKRSARQIEATKARMLAFVKGNPGAKGEAIREAVGETRAGVRLPLDQLLENGQLRKKGVKRGTQYWAK